MSIGGGGTQFSSTCDTCAVSDGAATIDRDESTYGTLEIVTAGSGGSGTMRATAQSGVVFPAGSHVGILQSIRFYGDVEMLLRTYENNVLQEEFVVELAYFSSPDDPEPVSFKTTHPYDAVEFSVSDDPDVTPQPPITCYGNPPVCFPNGPQVNARIHEFCSGPDVRPDAFTFIDQTGVEPGTTVMSAPVTITGIEAPASISVDGGEYSIDCTATYTASAGSISNGQTVCVRHTAAAGFDSSASTLLTVGGISDWFISTTRAEDAPDVTPDAFTFSDQADLEPGVQVTSAPVTITGIGAPAAISVSGGEYAIGCTATFTSAGGTIANNQTVCVRHTAAGTHGTATDTTLAVGDISDTFTSTTAAAPDAPAQGGGGGDGGGGGAPSPWLPGVLAALAMLRRLRSADPGPAE